MALCRTHKEVKLEFDLSSNVHLVSFKQGRIDIRLSTKAKPNLPNVLSKKLAEWTGEQWMVMVSREEGAQTVTDQRKAREQQLLDEISAHPLVEAAMKTFPGAKITGVTERDNDAHDPYDHEGTAPYSEDDE